MVPARASHDVKRSMSATVASSGVIPSSLQKTVKRRIFGSVVFVGGGGEGAGEEVEHEIVQVVCPDECADVVAH
jgi:hypothetical protein